jgi:hypothetical protein
VTSKLTWTFGIRASHNSPLDPHETIARLSGSFASISHNLDQPLDRDHSDRPPKCLRFHAGCDLATEDGNSVAARAKNRPEE